MGRRRYTADFKRRVVVEAMRGDQTVQAIAARHGINPNQVEPFGRPRPTTACWRCSATAREGAARRGTRRS